LEPIQQVDGVALTKEMVRNGLGHTVLPYVAVRDGLLGGLSRFTRSTTIRC
jgi:DNA-binding transcriptional LysR family regulator